MLSFDSIYLGLSRHRFSSLDFTGKGILVQFSHVSKTVRGLPGSQLVLSNIYWMGEKVPCPFASRKVLPIEARRIAILTLSALKNGVRATVKPPGRTHPSWPDTPFLAEGQSPKEEMGSEDSTGELSVLGKWSLQYGSEKFSQFFVSVESIAFQGGKTPKNDVSR